MSSPSPQARLLQEEPEQLQLFEDLGANMAALRRAVKEVAVARRSPRTVHELESDWKFFVEFCRFVGREPLPALPDTVQLYVAHALKSNKVVTVRRRLWAIGATHKDFGQRSPVDDDVRSLVNAAQRLKKEPPKQASALAPAQLGKLSRSMPRTAWGVRDRAMMLLGFAAAMRRSDIAGLDLADITLRKTGVSVRIRWSKTDQKGEGRTVAVFAGAKASTDPVRSLRDWLSVRGKTPGPLFVRIQTGGRVTTQRLSGEAVNDVLQSAVERAGIDPAGFSGHSLRSGSITAALREGVPESVVMKELSGHKTHENLSKYVRQAREFAVNPLAGVL